MLGAIRFFLSFFVFISHVPNNGMKLNLGVVAVILFYFISGFLMQKSYSRFLEYSSHPMCDFYIDRVLKLFPQYIIILILSLISISYLGTSKSIAIMNHDITAYKIFLNLILLPLNYVFEPFLIKGLMPHPIIPPAWSLSTEFHFYLLLPLVFNLKRKLILILLLLSMSIQFSSFFSSDWYFNSNNFGYRYIFGVLTIFIYGYFFSKRSDSFFKLLATAIWISFSTLLFVILPASNAWKNPMVQEVVLGGFLALPLGYFFISIKPTSQKIIKIDNFLGNLSYPIFISHFIALYLTDKILTSERSNSVCFYVLSMVLCFLIALALQYFQGYIEKFRLKRRGFSSLRETTSTN